MLKTNLSKKINPEKKLFKILKKHSGRDNTGSISVRHQGKRHKRYYRIIDFKRDKKDVFGKVVGIEYDPNRNAYLAKIEYVDNEKRYILCPKGLKIGDKIISSEKAEIKTGNSLPIKNIPVGVEIHNLEISPGMGGKIIRGAGGSAIVIAKEEKYTHIKLPSGEIRKFLENCHATIGVVGNESFKEQIIGKAGRKIRMGIRPTVRGTAQNPRTHPHGGGEGRVGEGMHPKTPWGKPARGKRTRKKQKWSNKLIIQRRK
jgi:large subunit ribosomal protein L2